MKKNLDLFEWASSYLGSIGYFLDDSPEIIQETPWSVVIRFTTSKGWFYLKQPARGLDQEASMLQLLAGRFNATVPEVVAVNEDLHCFLMKDAGQTLRSFLKNSFQPELMVKTIKQFTKMQRSVEQDLNLFFARKAADWRLDKLLGLYDQLVTQTEFLKAEGLTEQEIKILRVQSQKLSRYLGALAAYKIPETIVQPDFNTNNTLINIDTNQLTFIDLGEIAIANPFFSLHNFLYQATIHHDLKVDDLIYRKLQMSCIDNWLEYGSREELLKAFALSEKLWSVYSAVVYYHFMHTVGPEVLKAFYSNRPNQLANILRVFIKVC